MSMKGRGDTSGCRVTLELGPVNMTSAATVSPGSGQVRSRSGGLGVVAAASATAGSVPGQVRSRPGHGRAGSVS